LISKQELKKIDMKRSLIIRFTVVTAIVAAYSCKDDFLEVPPQNSLNLVTLGNEKGIDASLISAYSMLDGWNADWGNGPWGGQGSNWLFGDVMSDDAYKGTEPTDGANWEAMELFTWSPLDGDLDVKFRTDYEAISRVNNTLKLMASTTGLSEDFKNKITGEAEFLRGHYHFDLYKMFKHIPYYTEADVDFKKKNTTEGGDYIDPIDNIIADFQAAADLLPATQDQVGRATKGAALAYLGKAYLYNKQYAEAKAAFDQVVNSGVYSLQDCYHTVFSVAGENGSGSPLKRESLLAFQASSGDGSADAENANFPDRLTFPHAGSPFGCCGFRQPSQNLVNAYKVDANGLPLIDTYNNSTLTASDPVDPRLDWVVARPGVPVLNWEIPYSENWVRAPSYAGVFSNKKILYYSNSGQEGTGATWVPTQLSQLNVQLLRYADVVLMLAEAEVELNNLPRAMELVNMVRTRAKNCAQGPMQGDAAKVAVPINDPSITWATYRVEPYTSFPSQTFARTAVRFERRLELAMEGHRFFDLRRYGIAKQVMNDYMAVEKTRRSYIAKSQGYQDKHELYPIPQNQIDLSNKLNVPQLKQNPGW
jgi:starch-binding outer membrane protein, SusD/RagB family